jgi:C-terminal processing protease CtpA/Prc
MDLIYEGIVNRANTKVYKEIIIKKELDELLGIDFNKESLQITKDNRIIFPKMMVMNIKPNSIAEKYGLRLGTQILKIDNDDVTPENYNNFMKEKYIFKILLNDSYCEVYQTSLRENKFNFIR